MRQLSFSVWVDVPEKALLQLDMDIRELIRKKYPNAKIHSRNKEHRIKVPNDID